MQASVSYVPMLTNVNAKAYPNFDPSGTSFEVGSRYRTDHEGRYRLVGLPGRGVITVRADERGYRTGVGAQALAGPAYTNTIDTYTHLWTAEFHALKQVDVAKGADETRCDLALDPGGSVTVVMLDPDGKPLTDLVVDGRFPQGVDVGDMGVHESNVTRVAGLEPDETRRVVFKHDDLRLGAVLVLRPGEWKDGAEITVKLRPYATIIGRLVDANGKPARGGVEVRLPRSDPRVYGDINMNPVAADSEGRFRFEDIPPGGEFIVTATGRPISVGAKTTPAVFESFDLARNLKAEPGQVIDLGTFDAETGKRHRGRRRCEAVTRSRSSPPIRLRVTQADTSELRYRETTSSDQIQADLQRSTSCFHPLTVRGRERTYRPVSAKNNAIGSELVHHVVDDRRQIVRGPRSRRGRSDDARQLANHIFPLGDPADVGLPAR